MAEPKNTPGPWKVVRSRDGSGFIKILGPNGEIIDLFGNGYFNNKNIELIADAWQLPDLRKENAELKAINKEIIEVLEEIQSLINDSIGVAGHPQFDFITEWDEFGTPKDINKALRKARGEE